ncbi:MAG: alpha/beta hydrolase [Actinomycetota bacterium]|nr:alpha/beta hydrolase [Actinomycetota bacterium]MED6303825.1 alpha/beta hydrolase [Actinomycetota bacterium]
MVEDPELEALRAITKTDNEANELILGFRDLSAGSVAEARMGLPGVPPQPILESGTTRTIQVPGADIELRIFVPSSPRGVYLHLHGGGWVIGSAFDRDPKLEAVAMGTDSVAISVEYRLAPEFPYPTPLDDCEAAAQWVLENSEKEWGVRGVVIGGESAGAHLSATTALRVRDHLGMLDRVVGLNLVYGVFDLSMTPSQLSGRDLPLIPTKTMRWFYDHFLQGEVNPKDPRISPLYADLDGLPPSLLTVGTNDPLLDDSLFMAARLRSTNCEVALDVYPEAIHGFTVLPGAAGEVANKRANNFIASCWDRSELAL